MVFYLTLFLFIFGLGLYYNNIDNDFFARLIVGKTYFQTGGVLNWDFLSYTPTHRFIDHEWGSSLVFYFLQTHFGDIGLLVFKSIITFAAFYLICKTILLRDNGAKLHFLPFLFIINITASIILSTLRCQSFTFFFFALWLYVLERVRLKNQTRLLWILPATMLVWANVHGGCAAGFGLLGMYIIGEFLSGKPVKKYILALCASILTVFINPYGIEYAKFLFMALTLKRPFITEWQPTFSALGLKNHFKFIIFLGFTGVFFTIFAFKYKLKNIDKTKALVLIVTLLMALKSIRLQPFFVLCLLAYCYSDYYKIFPKKLPAGLDKAKEIILLIIIELFAINAVVTTQMACKVRNYPRAEVEFIKLNKIKGNILCEFHDGSYVAYKLYPQNLIFMDGKYEEVYPNHLVYMLRDIHLANSNMKANINRYPTDMIIMSNGYDAYEALRQDPDYVLMVKSKNYGLFLKKHLVRKDFKRPSESERYYIQTKFDTNITWELQNEN